jgi:hypothetical protein
MTVHSLQLDHLVVAARTLDEGVAHVTDALGVEPSGGGAHPLMRTHNRLFGLWGGAYLEVIALDPQAPPPAAGEPVRPRWFTLDAPATQARLAHGPYLAHWVARIARPRQLALWQRQYPDRIPPVAALTRGAFGWHLTLPADGGWPTWQGAGDGILPSLIQWDSAAHPTDTLPHDGLALRALRAVHPRPDPVREQLRWLNAASLVDLADAPSEPALVAEFDTPHGPRTLR